MTSVQFYFAIGLPIFSILLVWLGSTVANNRAIGAIGQRIDDLRSEMRAGIGDSGQRFEDLRSEMRAGFANVNQRLDRL